MSLPTELLASGLSVSGQLENLLSLRGIPAYGIVAFLAFAEAAFFAGFVLPGETAVVLGGVLASQHSVSLPGMAAAVVVAAIVGDTVGYEVGRHYGDRVLGSRLFSSRHVAVDRAKDYLRRKGSTAVFLGRFTAFLRAVMPGLAGTARMPYRRFIVANAAGALVWGVGFTLVGYVAGASYRSVEKVAGRASLGVLALVVLLVLLLHLRRRRAERREEATASASPQE